LAKRVKPYGVKSKVVRIGERTPRGYTAEDFFDAWNRYLPAFGSDECNKRNKRNNIDNKNNYVADVADVAEGMAEEAYSGANGAGTEVSQDSDPFASLKDKSLILDLPAFLDRRARA
jgi:Protein of unknown function (DUF3631)